MTVLGIAIGVATLFALLSLSSGIAMALDREIGGMGAHILLLPEGCPYALTIALMQGADTVEYIPGPNLESFRAVQNVALAVPVVVGRAKVNGQLAAVYGTSDAIFGVKQWGVSTFTGAIVGSDVANKQNLSVGQRITLDLYAEESLEVAKILPATGGRDDTFVFVPLAVGQSVIGVGDQLSAVLVQVNDITKVTETRYTLGRMSDVQAVPPSEVFDTLIGLFESVKQTLILITAIAIVAGILTTMNTMSMAVFERKKDIGLLRAVGSTQWNIFSLFVWESVLVSLVAGVLGVGLGYGASQFLPRTSGFGLEAAPHFSILFVGICLLVAIAVGTLSALYPAMIAARTQPIRTLREL
jgi:putative ABC transport system permease protein